MFGYVTIYRKDLPPEVIDRYQAYYCGLCEALGRRYGAAGRMTLSFDMTFAAVLLSALYDPETVYSTGRCAPHPLKPRPRAANRYVDYAADMSIALAYYNFLDDWQDEHRRGSLRSARRLEQHLPGIRRAHPAQCEAIRTRLDALTALEAAGSDDLDALCGCFGALLGAVFRYQNDMWAPVLDRLGRGLGGFIYLMDAYDDLEKDAKNGSFNALAALRARLDDEAFETRCHELLTQQMGICAEAFGLLPVLKDSPEGQLLYNTIYSGVWCKYTLIKARREDKRREAEKRHA